MNPPWPEPQNLAPAALAPPMDSRESFVADAVSRFNDDEFFAAARCEAARRLLANDDMHGGPAAAEIKQEQNTDIPNTLKSPRPPTPCIEKNKPSAQPLPSPDSIRILTAWLLTPREAFIPPSERQAAYLPNALPIGRGQTISAPYIVTRMTAFLNPAPSDNVLEIGTGSGYQAAMLAALCAHVRTVEYVGPLAAEAGRTLNELAKRRPWLRTIRRRIGSGYSGLGRKALRITE